MGQIKNNKMPIEKIYRFIKADYDNDGFHKQKHLFLFLNYIRECEASFHEKTLYFLLILYGQMPQLLCF